MCFHKFKEGMGLCGDAYTCIKCDYSKYPEYLSLWARICIWLGRVVKE